MLALSKMPYLYDVQSLTLREKVSLAGLLFKDVMEFGRQLRLLLAVFRQNPWRVWGLLGR